MSKHFTPGPWTWRKNLGCGSTLTTSYGGAKVVLAANVTGDYHAEITTRDERGVLVKIDADHPNARLIAAAPDLLEALRMCVTQFGMHPSSSAVEKARAAIAKAEGGQ